MLLDQGADIEARDGKQNTPLHTAIIGLGEDVARLLIDRGANTEAQNDTGDTALDIAVMAEQRLEAEGGYELGAMQNLVCFLQECSRRRSDSIT